MLVMLCVNNWRNGVFHGRLERVEIADLTLESPYMDSALRIRVDKIGITLGADRRTWPYSSYREWVGNWCWDACQMTPDNAADLLNFLLAFRYKPDVGPAELWDKIDAGLLLTADDFRKVGVM